MVTVEWTSVASRPFYLLLKSLGHPNQSTWSPLINRTCSDEISLERLLPVCPYLGTCIGAGPTGFFRRYV